MRARKSVGRELLWLVIVIGALLIGVLTLLDRTRESTGLDHDEATCQQYAEASTSRREAFADYWLHNFRGHDGKPDAPELVDDFRDDIAEGCAGEAPTEKATTAASRLYVAGRDLYGR
jgi:hypothetical protein